LDEVDGNQGIDQVQQALLDLLRAKEAS